MSLSKNYESKIYVPSYEIEVYQKKWINENAPEGTIIFLHGWLDNADSFLPLARKLNCKTIIALDLPGHCDTQFINAVSSYVLWDNVFFLEAYLEQLNLSGPIFIGGHSMGAAIAPLYVSLFPDKYKGLILYDGFGPFYVEEDLHKQFTSYLKAKKESKYLEKREFKSIKTALLARLKSGKMEESSAKVLLERALETVESGGYRFKYDPRLKLPTTYRFSEKQVISFFKKITCPTLFIQPTNSYVSKEVVQSRASILKERLTHTIVDGDHHFHMDKAEDTATITNLWLSKI